MNHEQLEHLALQVRNHNGGAYREKSLCQVCLMKKAHIASPQDKMEFGKVWRKWMMDKLVRQGTCIVCGHEREIMTLPATQ
jgi:hypothetical protein